MIRDNRVREIEKLVRRTMAISNRPTHSETLEIETLDAPRMNTEMGIGERERESQRLTE